MEAGSGVPKALAARARRSPGSAPETVTASRQAQKTREYRATAMLGVSPAGGTQVLVRRRCASLLRIGQISDVAQTRDLVAKRRWYKALSWSPTLVAVPRNR